MKTLLGMENLKTHFFTEKGVVRAVDGITCHVAPGEMLGIVGESGCGKSVTALSIMRLLTEPSGQIVEGKILFHGKDLASLEESTMRSMRGRKIAMIFQDPMTSLNPVLTLGYQLEEVLKIHSRLTKEERKERMKEVLELVGIPDPVRRLGDYPHQISGGMRQRVMIAMGLCCNPELLIADEPTTALDVTIQAQILDLLKELQNKLKMGIIFISHDLGVVSEMAQKIAVMYSGKIIEQGATRNIFQNPLHPYTTGLLESIPRLKGTGKGKDLATIPGSVPPPFDLPGGCRFHPRCPFALERCFQEEPLFFEPFPEHPVACWLYQKDNVSAQRGGLKQGFQISGSSRENFRCEKSGEVLLEVRDLHKHFSLRSRWGKPQTLKAVSGVSFAIPQGETLGLVGESGCGKTTTAKMIVGLEGPTQGNIFYRGQNLLSFRSRERHNLARKIQMIFQDCYSSLNPRMTVQEIVEEGLKIHGVGTPKERRKAAIKALDDAGLGAEFLHRYPHQFSGGQRQRIGIARALVMQPELIVCDEPVSALDVSIQAQVINLLGKLQRQKGFSYLFVAHDLSVVRHISHRVAVMYLGRIMEMGKTDTIFERWKHPYTEALLSAVPEVGDHQKRRIILEGDVPSPIAPPRGCPFSTRCHRKKGPLCQEKIPPLQDLGGEHMVACWYHI